MSGCDGWQADGGIIAQRCDGFQAHVARALHRPLIVLFKQKCPDELNDGGLVGEDINPTPSTANAFRMRSLSDVFVTIS